MSTEAKERWIEALKSGEYQQRKGSGQYCCLGVLADPTVSETRKRRLRMPRLPFVIISRRRLEELEEG